MASALQSIPGFAPIDHCLKLPEGKMEACAAEVQARNHADGDCLVGTLIGVVGGAAVSIGATPWVGVPAGAAFTAWYCKDTGKRLLSEPSAPRGVALRAPQNAPRASQAAIPASASAAALLPPATRKP